ncbi:MAG: hypothetical protein GY816_11775 [Cytophagales bacterium]|nr:hypothetical protein [Cytophagales bacterium]
MSGKVVIRWKDDAGKFDGPPQTWPKRDIRAKTWAPDEEIKARYKGKWYNAVIISQR